ncbi:MAG: biopolymer transporter ExbD [Pirellulales bacterium]|nr:biopolymer transporter ExbD [Pirellulales bacterium]
MPLKTSPPEEPTLNLTPMIDVILTLVLFFMVAAKFTEAERSIDLKVPTISTKDALSNPPEPKVVNVLPDGRVLLGTMPVTIDELEKQLGAARSKYQKQTVLVRGDRDATHGRMSEIYTACRRAGITEVAISVKVDTKRR